MEKSTTNRGLKNRTAISTSLSNENYTALKEYSEKTMIPMSKLIDSAVQTFLNTMSASK